MDCRLTIPPVIGSNINTTNSNNGHITTSPALFIRMAILVSLTLCAVNVAPAQASVTSTKSSSSLKRRNDDTIAEWKSFHLSEYCCSPAPPATNRFATFHALIYILSNSLSPDATYSIPHAQDASRTVKWLFLFICDTPSVVKDISSQIIVVIAMAIEKIRILFKPRFIR